MTINFKENMKKQEKCENCGGDTAIRNPTGKCDHLYYPENLATLNKETEELDSNLEALFNDAIRLWLAESRGHITKQERAEQEKEIDQEGKELIRAYQKSAYEQGVRDGKNCGKGGQIFTIAFNIKKFAILLFAVALPWVLVLSLLTKALCN